MTYLIFVSTNMKIFSYFLLQLLFSEGVDEMTDEGFAILDPPRAASTGTITRTLFQRVSRSDQDSV